MPAAAGRQGAVADGETEPSRPAGSHRAAGPGRVGSIVLALIAGPLLWIAFGPGDGPSAGDGRSGDVALPEPDQVEQPAADGDGDAGVDEETPEAATPGLGCTPLGCARWRLDDLDPRRLHVHEQLLVYVDESRVTTLDPTDGSEVHQLDLPVPGGGQLARTASATYVDEEYLAVAHERVFSLVALPDGQLERQVLLDTSVHGISRTGDGWTLNGVAGGDHEGRPPQQLLGLDRTGQHRWAREVVTPFSLPEGTDVLVLADGQLQLVDLSDGTTRWARPIDPQRAWVRSGDPLLLVDQSADRLEIVDRGSGELLADLEVSGIVHVGHVGPWVFAATRTELLLFDPAAGREVARREHDATRPVMADGITIGEEGERRVVVAWPYTGGDGSDQQELVEVYALDGTLLRSIRIPVSATALTAGPWPSEIADLGDGVVRVAVGLGRDLVEVDTATGRILDERHRELAAGEGAFWFGSARDGVFAYGTDERIRLEGRAGSIAVHGTEPRLRFQHPLLVTDGSQLLRLDERVLHGR